MWSIDSSQAKGLHGLAEENEDIRVHVVKREQAYQWMCDGKIDNGIAVMGLQWLQLNYAHCSNAGNRSPMNNRFEYEPASEIVKLLQITDPTFV